MTQPSSWRRTWRALAPGILYFYGCLATHAQSQPASAGKSQIRAITAFVDLQPAEYGTQIAEAVKTLKLARMTFATRGYTVQKLCIATPPFAEYTREMNAAQALAFFQKLDALAEKENIEISIGPAMYRARDSESQAELLSNILLNTKFLTGSLVVADKDGLRGNAARAAARVIKKLSEGTPNSEGALRFAALAMVPPLIPSLPSAYVDGFAHQFSIALQSAKLVSKSTNLATDPGIAEQNLTEAFAAEAYDIDEIAGRVDGETGWAYVGVDLTPLPARDDSVAESLESMSGHQAGSPEAIAAGKTITAAIQQVSLKQAGFGTLALPILEDRRLAQRWSEGRIGIDTLLDYFAAGSTGLDAVPLPGDISNSQLELIIVNAASQAYRARKPLELRLVPVANKVAGDRTTFENEHLVNVTLQPLNYPLAKAAPANK
jgi:uncharacterized protein